MRLRVRTTCAGNCGTANGYFQSSPIPTDDDSLNPFAQAVFTETWKQSGFLLNWGNTIAGCTAQNYGLTGAAAATGAEGYPVAKSALGVGRGLGGDASAYTSARGAAAFKAFGANEPRFTGVAGRLAKNLTGTARMVGAAGRVAQKAAPVLAGADAASIGYCVYSTVTR